MSDPIATSQGQIDGYLATLRRELAGLPAGEIEEILRELRGHIAERSAESGAERNGTPIEQILRQLGAPRHIASLYLTEAQAAHARAIFSPALIVRATVRWGTKTAVGFVALLAGLVGYLTGIAFIACAVLKPLFPTNVGLWVNAQGMLFGFGNPGQPGPELLGWWFIPIALMAGAAFVVGTTALLRWMLRFAPRASRQVASLI